MSEPEIELSTSPSPPGYRAGGSGDFSKGLRIISPENHLLFTDILQRIIRTPSCFGKNYLTHSKGRMVKRKFSFSSPSWNQRAEKSVIFEMCWIGFSADAAGIDSNSQSQVFRIIFRAVT